MSNGAAPLQDIFCSGQQGFELDSRFEVSGIAELNEFPSPPPPVSTPTNQQIGGEKSPSLTSPRKRMMETFPKSEILKGCVAFVDVWADSGLANRSAVFMKILEKMGATVEKKFTKDKAITHLVFKDGHKSYLKKAKERGVKVVSIEWVDRCRVKQLWVNEKDYLFDDTNYKPPKKFRQMQPVSFEETQQKTEQKVKQFFAKEQQRKAKIDRRYEEIINNHGKSKDGSCSSPAESRVLVSDTPHVAVHSPHRFFYPHMIAETPNVVLEKRLERVKQGKPIFSPPTSASDEELDTFDFPRRKITPHNRRYRRSRKDSIPCRPPIISNIKLEALKEDDSDFPQSSQDCSYKALHINKKSTDNNNNNNETTQVADTASSVGITTSSVDTSSDMELTCDNIRPIYDARNNLVSEKDLTAATMNSGYSQTSSMDDGKSDSSNFTLHLSTDDNISQQSNKSSQPKFDEYRQKKDTSIQSDTTTACNCSLDTSKNSTAPDNDDSFKIPSSPAAVVMTSQSSSSCVTSSKKKKPLPSSNESDVIAARIDRRLTIDSGKKQKKERTKKTKEDVKRRKTLGNGRKAVRRLCDEVQSPTNTLLLTTTSQVDTTDPTEHTDPLISTPIQKTARKRRKSSFLFAFNPIVVDHHQQKKKDADEMMVDKISTSNITVRRKIIKKKTKKIANKKPPGSTQSSTQSSTPISSNQSSQDDPTYRNSTKKNESPPSFTTRRFTRASIGTKMRKEKILSDLYTETDESSPSAPSTPTTSHKTSATTPTTKVTDFHISTPERIKLNPRHSACGGSNNNTMFHHSSTPAKKRKDDDCEESEDYFDGFEEEQLLKDTTNFTEKIEAAESHHHQQVTSKKVVDSLVNTSLDDFISPNSSKAKQRAYHIAKKYSIALTGMNHAKRKKMSEMIRQLGGNIVSKLAYADEATHVITSDGRKTINIYFAICRGLWIVDENWIMESWKEGKWLKCDNYEKKYPAGIKNRIFRNKLLPHDRNNWYQQIFLNINIYISPHARPEPETFKTFVHYCGGRLCTDPQKADICVASSTVEPSDIVWVSGKWVYDSIYHGEVQSVEDYQL